MDACGRVSPHLCFCVCASVSVVLELISDNWLAVIARAATEEPHLIRKGLQVALVVCVCLVPRGIRVRLRGGWLEGAVVVGMEGEGGYA